MKTRMNVGISSLILIFIVLCLVTVGLLSMSSARNDLTWPEERGGCEGYYRADGEGERVLARSKGSRIRQDAEAQGLSGAAREAYLQAQLGDFYQDGLAVTDIGMEYGQALQIELDLAGEKIQVRSWQCV